MNRAQRRAEARQLATDLRSRIAADERRSWWSGRSLSWLAVVKILLQILLLFMDSEDD